MRRVSICAACRSCPGCSASAFGAVERGPHAQRDARIDPGRTYPRSADPACTVCRARAVAQGPCAGLSRSPEVGFWLLRDVRVCAPCGRDVRRLLPVRRELARSRQSQVSPRPSLRIYHISGATRSSEGFVITVVGASSWRPQLVAIPTRSFAPSGARAARVGQASSHVVVSILLKPPLLPRRARSRDTIHGQRHSGLDSRVNDDPLRCTAPCGADAHGIIARLQPR